MFYRAEKKLYNNYDFESYLFTVYFNKIKNVLIHVSGKPFVKGLNLHCRKS